MGIGSDSVISRLGANLTNILLPLYLTSYQIGLFNGAFKPFVLLAFTCESCMRFFTPYIAGVKDSSKDELEKHLSFMHKLVAFFTLTILIIPVFFSNPLIKLVYGDNLIASTPYMAALALGYMIYYLPPQSPPLMALGMEWKVIWCSVVKLLINLIALITLIPKYEIWGAVIAINLSFFGYWVATLLLYRRAKLRPVNKPFNYFGFAIITFSLSYAISKFLSGGLLGIAVFLSISGLISLIVYWDNSERRVVGTHMIEFMKKLPTNRGTAGSS
jgi:O-antigen/teichoic acid export membrane protein